MIWSVRVSSEELSEAHLFPESINPSSKLLSLKTYACNLHFPNHTHCLNSDGGGGGVFAIPCAGSD